MTEARLVSKLDKLVWWARKRVALYRSLYTGAARISTLKQFNRLPLLTGSMLSCARLIDTLADDLAPCITRTYGDHPNFETYLPKLLSYDDVLMEYRVLGFLMNVAAMGRRNRVMLVADEDYTYTMAEFGRYLGFYEWPLFAFVIRGETHERLAAHMARFQPTALFWDSGSGPAAGLLASSVRYLFTFNRHDVELPRRCQWFDFFRDSNAGLAAIRAGTSRHYTFAPQYHYFESTATGTLALTSFVHKLQPFIRYNTERSGSVIAPGKLLLN